MTRHLHALPGDGTGPMDPPPHGWDPDVWSAALAAARRALHADALARQSHPPALVGFRAFNIARGEVMERLDREAGVPSVPVSQANASTKPQVRVVESGTEGGPGDVVSAPGPWPTPAEEVQA